MCNVLGIDTSNYTTSAALIDTAKMIVYQSKKLLPVKSGEIGIRQSDAVFHHTKQLPLVISELLRNSDIKNLSVKAVGVSKSPRLVKDSYMPCFLVGEGFCESFTKITGVNLHKTSHQTGHVLSALYSSDKLDLIKNKDRFIAFHISGGTTDCLLCEHDDKSILKITQIGTSLDLKAGQAIDRLGVKLGLDFPCGPELEKLALKSDKTFKTNPAIKGNDCCLSGLQNKCEKMLSDGEQMCDIAKFCLSFIKDTIFAMSEKARKMYNDTPIIFVGGVMSNTIIKEEIQNTFENVYFAEPEFSCDNAVGTALYAAIKEGLI